MSPQDADRDESFSTKIENISSYLRKLSPFAHSRKFSKELQTAWLFATLPNELFTVLVIYYDQQRSILRRSKYTKK